MTFEDIVFRPMEQTYTVKDHDQTFCKALQDMWRTGTLCDAAIEVGSRVFKAHKLVLAAGSPVLSSMACCLPDNTHMCVQLPVETQTTALELIIDFFYTGHITLSSSVYQMVLQLAEMFQVKSLVDFCKTFHGNSKTPFSRKKLTDVESVPKKETAINVKSESSHVKRGRGRGLKVGLKPSRGRSRASETLSSIQVDTKQALRVSLRTGRGRGRGRGRRRGHGRVSCRGRSSSSPGKMKTENILDSFGQVLSPDSSLHFPSPGLRTSKATPCVSKSPIEDNSAQNLSEDIHHLVSGGNSTNRDKTACRGKKGPKTRAEIQRAYRERKLAGMTEEQILEHKAKEANRVRMSNYLRNGLPVTGIRGPRGHRRRGMGRDQALAVALRFGRALKKEVDQEGCCRATVSQTLARNVEERRKASCRERMRKFRERKKLSDPDYLKRESVRKRERYIPRALLSTTELKQRRQKDNFYQRNYRRRQKQKDLQEQIQNEPDTTFEPEEQSLLARHPSGTGSFGLSTMIPETGGGIFGNYSTELGYSAEQQGLVDSYGTVHGIEKRTVLPVFLHASNSDSVPQMIQAETHMEQCLGHVERNMSEDSQILCGSSIKQEAFDIVVTNTGDTDVHPVLNGPAEMNAEYCAVSTMNDIVHANPVALTMTSDIAD